jgi:hypothetical protein
VISTSKGENPAMSADILAIVTATTVQLLGLLLLGWYLSRMLRQITAEVTYNVLQGRRIEEVLRDMRESISEIRGSRRDNLLFGL